MGTAFEASLFDELVTVRRDLHQHPELSWDEVRTAERVCAFLDRYGVSYRNAIGRTGVIAEIPGATDAPFVALRADMDALPITEETGLPFASIHDGRMHACGHDAHTSMLLGAAALLVRERNLPAPVRLIFQPAEEVGEGAQEMIRNGALTDVAMIFGGHVDRHFTTGKIAVTDGPVNASTDSFRITIHGEGAHAARPHEGIDAVVVGTLIVSAIQTIVSREVNPAHPSVVTIGRFDAGTAPNVIAGTAVLEGTVRAQEADVRNHLIASVDRMALAAGHLHGAHVTFEVLSSTPPVSNPVDVADIARVAAKEIAGDDNVCPMEIANMGAEDFGNYMQLVPGCYVRFGSRVAGKEGYPAHSSRFDVDEDVLRIGAAYYHAVARHAGAVVAPRAGVE
ncbi:MAG: amidohydrolase [Planctomycetes bacterium]|nr:amidohydrolase [Planctomycetota bacterium]